MDMRNPMTATSVIAALAAAVVLASPAPGQAAETGINSQDLSAPDTVARAEALHAKWIRRFVRWDELQPARGSSFNAGVISYLDELTSLAAARGQKVQLTLIGAPQWANGSTDHLVPPANPREFADDFAAPLARRYAGRVQAWEVWNEPDEPEFWHGPAPGAGPYAALLEPTYAAIKAEDPAALVFGGPLTGNNYRFVEDLYKVGAGDSFDGISVHTDTACNLKAPSDFYREDGRIGRFTFLGFREVREVMVANGDAGKPIMMSELGWSTTTTRCARGVWAGQKDAGVSEAAQAAYLQQAYHCLAQYPYVNAGVWFSLRDTSTADTELSRYGLMSYGLVQKPSWAAMASVGRDGDRLSGACGDFEGPKLTVYQPTDNVIYNNKLELSASASDELSPIARIRFSVGGDGIGLFRGLKNDQRVGRTWWRAGDQPYGPVKILVETSDSYGNKVTREVTAQHVNPKSLPSQRSRLALRLSGKGKRRTVYGKVHVAGTQLEATGTLRISWQKKVGGRWVTKYRRNRFAHADIKLSRTLPAGTWRVRAQYPGQRPFTAVTATSNRSRVR
jgi:hypothetical protein